MPVFSKSLDEIYWTADSPTNICFSKQIDEKWTKPMIVEFDSEYNDGEPFLSKDENRLYFTSTRPVPDSIKTSNENIWFVKRKKNGWSEPKLLTSIVNSHKIHWQFSLANNGNLYFGESEIYKAEYKNGTFIKTEKLNNLINSKYSETSPYISPDEKFIIFQRFDNGHHLFISFKTENNEWDKPINIHQYLGAIKTALCPSVSPDGKYLFFISSFNGNQDIYWIDFNSILESIKQDRK